MERTGARSGLKIVLLFAKPMFHSHRERIGGIYAAAIKRGWQVQQVDRTPTRELVDECIRLWNPIGCLIDPSIMTSHMGRRDFCRLPSVIMGHGEARLKWQLFDCSFQNSREPAQMAAKHLSRLGMENFAFVGDPALPSWSVERGKFFREAVAGNAFFSEYAAPDPGTMRGRRAMVGWMRSLPLPCGCFLAADHLAVPFYAAASEAGLKIGADLPTIGVDDDERVCSSLIPALSSIQLDFFQSGVNAVALLEKRLAAPDRPPETATYGVLGVVRRASTAQSYGDRRVTRAMQMIEERGCGKLAISEIAAAMGCSSRLAEQLFKRHAGMSILDAIRKVRLEKTFSLLRNRAVPIDAIPFQCGYGASPACLKTYFKRQTGLTMREWRQHVR